MVRDAGRARHRPARIVHHIDPLLDPKGAVLGTPPPSLEPPSVYFISSTFTPGLFFPGEPVWGGCSRRENCRWDPSPIFCKLLRTRLRQPPERRGRGRGDVATRFVNY
jgi:hypothetical protein